MRDHARRVRTGETPAATASLPVKTARTAARRGSLTFRTTRAPLTFEPGRRRRASRPGPALLERHAHAGERARAGHDDADRAAGRRVGLGRDEAHDAQRGRALHRADVGELQTGRVGARDRERDAAAAQRGDRHAHGAPALARDRACRASARPRSASTLGLQPGDAADPDADRGRVRGDAEESRCAARTGPAPAVSSAPAGSPTARRAAPRTRRMPAATCSLSPTRARSTASCAPHHGIEHQAHVCAR